MSKIKGKQLESSSIEQSKINVSMVSVVDNDNVTSKQYVDETISEKATLYYSKLNLNMQANNTTGVEQKACNTQVIEFPISNVLVKVNGSLVDVGETKDCYFSPDGVIKRINGQAQKGDFLYWNSTKYNLDTTDEIDFIYLVGYYYYNLSGGTTVELNPVYNSAVVRFTGDVGQNVNVVIDGNTFICGNIGGQFVWDIGGYYEHVFTSPGESIIITVNGQNFTIWFDGFGSLIFSVMSGIHEHIIKDFDMGTGLTGNTSEGIMDTILTSSNNLLLSGNITAYNGIGINHLIKIDTNGVLDLNFNPPLNNSVDAIYEQPNGKILAGGYFATYSGVTCNRIVRLNSDGSIDNTFNIGSGFNGNVRTINYTTDGKILVGGNYTSYSGVSCNRLIMLNDNGSIYTGFTVGTGFNAVILTTKIQSDGKILVGGNQTLYDGVAQGYITRLNTNGTLDTTFNSGGSGFSGGAVFQIEFQSDGKIICVGNFTAYNGIPQRYVCRLNSNGSLDQTFNNQLSGVTNQCRCLLVLDDDKLLVGGKFTGNIIKLDRNGNLYNEFNINGSGFNDQVVKIIKDSNNNNIYCGGRFTTFNSESHTYFIKLNQNGSSLTT